MIKSAGLVLIYDNKILLVHPTGAKWYGTYSIPKGHVEKEENIWEAALRETKEEIGVDINDDINVIDKGYIDYKNDDIVYKRIYYFVIKLNQPIIIDKSKLQKEEIDWAGFLTKEEANKRIFWRLKPLLQYLDNKIVRESLK